MSLEVEGYWLKMGAVGVDALTDILRDDLTPKQSAALAEYLGGILNDAYNMGIRLGEARGRFARGHDKP